jgi:oligosaccharide repeat unit polymerase
MIQKNYTTPSFIFVLTWLIVLVSYHLSLTTTDFQYIISNSTFLLINFGSFCFSSGCLLSVKKYVSLSDAKPILNYSWSKSFDYFITIFLTVFLFLQYSYLSNELDVHDNISSFLIQLRYLKNYEDLDYGIYAYIGTVSVFNLGIRILRGIKSKHDSFFLIISIFIAISFAILSTGRTNFFLLILMAIGSLIVKGEISLFSVFKYFTFTLISFAVIGVLLNKGGNIDNDFQSNLELMFNNITGYLVGPICALDVFLSKEFTLGYGQNTFRFVNAFLFKMGLSSNEPISLVEDFVHIPYPVNVYTIYKKYLLDFGYTITFIILFILGSLTSILFTKAIQSSSITYKYMYCLMMFPIILSFFNEQFFSILSQWIQHFILIYLFNLFFFKKQETYD